MARPPIPLVLAGALALAGSSLAQSGTAAHPPKPGASVPAAPSSKPAPPAKLVDLNLASHNELKTLPGIGDAEAAKIVAARPYKSKADLVTKNVLPLEAYDRLSKQVVVDLRKPAPKPKS